MSKELVREIIESLVDEKTVKQIVEEKVEDKVNCLLENQFKYAIRNKAQELANLIAKEKVDKIIDESFSKEVVVNDGWYPSKKYNSFEDLVKERIFAETSATNIERAVYRRVDKKIEEACKQIVKENEEKFAEQVLKNLGGKNG